MLSSLVAGTAVFAISDRHVPCAPVGLKPLFIAADHWRRTGVLDAITIELLVAGEHLVDLPRADRELRAAAERTACACAPRTTVESVDASRGRCGSDPAGPTTCAYDALYLAPPHRAPDGWPSSGCRRPRATASSTSTRGPSSTAPTRRSGGWATRRRSTRCPPAVPCASRCPSSRTTSRPAGPARRCGGTTGTPSPRSPRRAVSSCSPSSTATAAPSRPRPVPDLVRPRRSLLVFDRYVEPQVYWHRLLKGKVS